MRTARAFADKLLESVEEDDEFSIAAPIANVLRKQNRQEFLELERIANCCSAIQLFIYLDVCMQMSLRPIASQCLIDESDQRINGFYSGQNAQCFEQFRSILKRKIIQIIKSGIDDYRALLQAVFYFFHELVILDLTAHRRFVDIASSELQREKKIARLEERKFATEIGEFILPSIEKHAHVGAVDEIMQENINVAENARVQLFALVELANELIDQTAFADAARTVIIQHDRTA